MSLRLPTGLGRRGSQTGDHELLLMRSVGQPHLEHSDDSRDSF